MNNFILSCVDTDAVTFGKPDGTMFTKEEIQKLNVGLNSLNGEYIKWDFEDSYKKLIAIRTKNYILLNQDNKLTIKGSALKASTKSPKMKQFIKDIIQSILDETSYIEIYERYVAEIANITDISQWAVRKTIGDKIMTGERRNETNVRDAIAGTEIVAGDRCYVFFLENGDLCLTQNFNGDYSKDRLYQQVYDSMKVFSTVLDMTPILNYKLKKNKKYLK